MDELVVWSAIGLVTGVGFFLGGFKKLRLRRRILALPTSKIRSMAMGIIELDGRVRLEAPLKDPIFSRPCAFWRIVVREKRGNGKNSRWVTIYNQDSSATPFLLDDGTGVARVFPAKADIYFPPEVNGSGGTLFSALSAGDEVSRFLRSLPGAGHRQLTAHILREGQPLFLLGHAAPLANAGTLAPMESRDIARALKSDPAAMKALDTNGDGAVDQQEWDAGLAKKSAEMAESERTRQLAEAPVVDPIIDVARCPDGLFVLSDSQDGLLTKLGWTSWAGIIAGPLIALASAAYLFSKFQ